MQIDPLVLVADARFDAVTALLVVDRLVLSSPADLSRDLKQARRDMVAARNAVAKVREERAKLRPIGLRPFVGPFNASWGGLSTALASLASLPPEAGLTRPARARRMQHDLFPGEGAPALQKDAETVYVQANERIERIERDGLEDELVALVGREYVDAIRKTTAALGEVLGVGRTVRRPRGGPTMRIALKQLARAVSRYARKLLADLDEEDDASVERFTSALAPLIEHKLIPRQSTPDEEDGTEVEATEDALPASGTPTNPTPAIATPANDSSAPTPVLSANGAPASPFVA